MRFALVDNKRFEAKPGLKGLCPGCSQPVIAKCGRQRVHHWAHQANGTCDRWWEPETEWHRSWKSLFPADCQEVFLSDDQTGEKHVADVRTNHGLVIEFQHSHIKPEERISREQFYKNMIWVVDGTRLKRDWLRFKKQHDDHRKFGDSEFLSVSFPDETFPKIWIESAIPVVFDFKDNTPSEDPKDILKERLWVLLPGRRGTMQ